MMDTPDGLVGKSREERSVHGFTDLDDGPTDVFPKSLLVAEFVTEGCISYEDNVLAENSDFEDLACVGERDQQTGGAGRLGRVSPYFSHSFCRETQVLLGSTSEMLPSRGTPGGLGILVVMVGGGMGLQLRTLRDSSMMGEHFDLLRASGVVTWFICTVGQ